MEERFGEDGQPEGDEVEFYKCEEIRNSARQLEKLKNNCRLPRVRNMVFKYLLSLVNVRMFQSVRVIICKKHCGTIVGFDRCDMYNF